MDKLFPSNLSLIGRVGFGALLLVLLLAPGIGGYPTGALYGEDVPLNALRALTAIAALCLAFSPPAPSGGALPAGGNVPLHRVSVFAIWGAAILSTLSLLVHSHFFTSPVLLFAMLPGALDWLCYTLVFTVCALLVSRQRSTLPALIGALAIGTAWAAFTGIREYGQYAQAGQKDHRISATFFDPNFIAGFLALMLPIFAAAFCAARERLGVLLLGVLTALTFGALVATGSRAGLGIAVASLIVAIVLALISGGPRSLPWGRIGALLVFSALLAFGFRGPITTRVTGSPDAAAGGQEHSGSFRVYTWKGTAAMAKANPVLGTGPGTFPYRYPVYAQVAKTELAHDSYLQTAAENGIPALLAALAALLFAALGGLSALGRLRRATEDESASVQRLLLCGLLCGLLAGAARSIFDSEWSILGNALPFWAVAGMVSAPVLPAASETMVDGKAKISWGSGIAALATLVCALILLNAAQTIDAAKAQIQARQPAAPASVWPPSPDLLFWSGNAEEAARIDPSGKRWYQWARLKEREGNEAEAVALFQKAKEADPNNLQTFRALAEAQEKAGDAAGALTTWRDLIHCYEGPAGQVRAIPELPETHPAYAYAAVARAAEKSGDQSGAISGYEGAAKVIESYSRITPTYQVMELASASMNNVDVEARRQEVRALYQEAMHSLARLEPAKSSELQQRETGTLTRLDAFAKPDTVTVSGGASASTP